MNILGIILTFFSFSMHFLLPVNYNFENHFCIVFYLISILSLCILLYKLMCIKKFNYDILFLLMTLWVSNFMGFLYLNVFNNIIISFCCYLVCLIDVIFLFRDIKKINTSNKNLYLLIIHYIYLLISFIKFF